MTKALSYDSFHPQALELCARESKKVAAASGDMRKALSVCRSAIEVLEAELREVNANLDPQGEKTPSAQLVTVPIEFLTKQEMDIVRVDHMALALSKTFKSVIVDTIQLLPQHQQISFFVIKTVCDITLCSTVKLFRKAKADTTMGELYKSYSDICKTARVSPASMLEFSNMCRVLADQGLIRLGQSREEKLKRIALKVDEGDITFALQYRHPSYQALPIGIKGKVLSSEKNSAFFPLAEFLFPLFPEMVDLILRSAFDYHEVKTCYCMTKRSSHVTELAGSLGNSKTFGLENST
ncbi:AAA ATPase [Asimina triloba]